MTIDEFIAWASLASGSEIANAQSFTRELCIALDLPPPNLAKDDAAANDYVFERCVLFQHGDGSSTKFPRRSEATYRRQSPQACVAAHAAGAHENRRHADR